MNFVSAHTVIESSPWCVPIWDTRIRPLISMTHIYTVISVVWNLYRSIQSYVARTGLLNNLSFLKSVSIYSITSVMWISDRPIQLFQSSETHVGPFSHTKLVSACSVISVIWNLYWLNQSCEACIGLFNLALNEQARFNQVNDFVFANSVMWRLDSLFNSFSHLKLGSTDLFISVIQNSYWFIQSYESRINALNDFNQLKLLSAYLFIFVIWNLYCPIQS